MNGWRLIARNELKEIVNTEEPPEAGEVRVKIFNAMMDNFDWQVYAGNIPASYPIVPARYAVGRVVSHGKDGTFPPKGTRVFINPVFVNEKFDGDSTPLLGMDSLLFAGQTSDGFASPYAVIPAKNLYPLPESVSNEEACYAYLIALADATIDKLGDVAGKYIAVIGATTLGILLCRLLTYYQAVPILVDGHTARLDFARKCGITYTFLNDENLEANVNDITGAAFADGTVYIAAGSPIVGVQAFRLTAPRKNVVFCGYAPTGLKVDLEIALKKELHIFGVNNATDNIPTAINLLANKVSDVKTFPVRTYSLDDLPKVYEDAKQNAEQMECPALIDCYGKL